MAEKWVTRKDRSGSEIQSLAVAEFKDITVGISGSGAWTSIGENGLVTTLEEVPVSGLRLLATPLAEVRSTLARRIADLGLITTAAKFPEETIVRFALVGRMEFWATLALGWIRESPDDFHVLDELGAVQRSKWASQSLRHSARTLRSRMKQFP
jgi:hypothetical protein